MAPRTRPSAAVDQGPKAPIDLHPTCVIDGSAILTGTFPITIGAGSVIHTRAKLNSINGPITIGEGCMIGEKCLIQPSDTSGITIGENVLVECNAIVEAKDVGDGTDIEVGVKIGKGAFIGKHCKLCPLTEVGEQEVLPEYTVVYGYNERRTDLSGSEMGRKKIHEKHLETLRKLMTSNPGKFK